MSKRSWNIDSLVLIFSFIIIAQLLSYVIPHGEFDRERAKHWIQARDAESPTLLVVEREASHFVASGFPLQSVSHIADTAETEEPRFRVEALADVIDGRVLVLRSGKKSYHVVKTA